MAMKRIKIGKRFVYLEAEHADRILVKMTEISEEIAVKVEKGLKKLHDRDRKIAREMKQRGICPNGPGSQLAGWVSSRHKGPEKKSLNENPLVYSI